MVGHAGLFHKLKSYRMSHEIFGLFAVIEDFERFWMGSLQKTIQLMLDFLNAQFLVLQFSYYTLMTFLMILCVILLPMLMILLSTLSVIRYLVCGNNQNWLLNLNLIYETLQTEQGSDLLTSMLEKLSLFCLISFLTVVLLLRKFIVYSSFKMLGLPFSSKLDRGSCIISIAKTTSKKIGALIRSRELLSPEIALYIFKSIIRSCMGYCRHFWVAPLSYYLKLLDKLQKRICKTVHPSLPASLEPLVHCRNGASFSLFLAIIPVDVHLNWSYWLHFLIFERSLLVILKSQISLGCLHQQSLCTHYQNLDFYAHKSILPMI